MPGTAPTAEVSATTTGSVVARYRDMVYAIALTHTRDKTDADDVFQEVFLAYHRKLPVVRDEEHRKAWLIVTAVNCAKQVTASSWRRKTVPLPVEGAEAAVPATFTFKTEQQDAIFRAMSALPEAQRTAMHLFYFEDLPIARIAELLDLELGAVKMRLSRGRELMRGQLQGAYFND